MDGKKNAPVRRMRRTEAAQYLQDVHGIPFSEKTLRNRNASGLAPRPEYFGTIPFYRQETLDSFAASAFTAESPVAVLRRQMSASAEQAA